ncbi:single-stranded DNA-binding protein [Candidatus Saccharibacteria bacterium]|nr:single-stranded DNA-binding protein [Candidatus Saccharibacteria bacterium]
MARSFNKVILIGNLTRDPEVRALPSGTEFCRFGLAVNYSYRTADGEDKESVDFIDISVWRPGLVSIVQTYCHKGKQVMVEGRLTSSSWEQDGQTRSKLEVKVDNILLLGSAGGGQGGAPAERPAQASKPAGKAAEEDFGTEEDYELEALNYDQEGVNPEDIPF